MSGTPWADDSVEPGQGRLLDRAADSPCQTVDATCTAGSLSVDVTTRTGSTVSGAKSSCSFDGDQGASLGRQRGSFGNSRKIVTCKAAGVPYVLVSVRQTVSDCE